MFGFGLGVSPIAHRGRRISVHNLDGVTTYAAGGFKTLYTTYAGPLARLRRVSDLAVRDFYADRNGVIDYAAISGWAGGSAIKVSTIYDQSGNGRDALPLSTSANGSLEPLFDMSVPGVPCASCDGVTGQGLECANTLDFANGKAQVGGYMAFSPSTFTNSRNLIYAPQPVTTSYRIRLIVSVSGQITVDNRRLDGDVATQKSSVRVATLNNWHRVGGGAAFVGAAKAYPSFDGLRNRQAITQGTGLTTASSAGGGVRLLRGYSASGYAAGRMAAFVLVDTDVYTINGQLAVGRIDAVLTGCTIAGSQPDLIEAWGHSLVAGFNKTSNTADNADVTAFPSIINGLYTPRRTTTNEGVSGQNAAGVLARFQSAQNYRKRIIIVDFGDNDLNGLTTQAQFDAAKASILSAWATIAAVVDQNNGKLLILGLLTDPSESSGATGTALLTWQNTTDLNNQAAAIYGNRFVDINAALITQNNPATEAAYTATGTPGPSVRDDYPTDETHLSNAAYAFVGATVVDRIVARGW